MKINIGLPLCSNTVNENNTATTNFNRPRIPFIDYIELYPACSFFHKRKTFSYYHWVLHYITDVKN